jgi:recombinational DNA repair ATPase RecF
MKLKEVKIHKYKSFETAQKFELEEDITVLVGMNESGKTSALESLAKTHYFQEDEDFKFNATHDYPRKDKKRIYNMFRFHKPIEIFTPRHVCRPEGRELEVDTQLQYSKGGALCKCVGDR